MGLAAVMIYFDQYFMSNLCKCYLNDQLCCSIRGVASFQSNYTAIINECSIAPIRCPAIPYDKLAFIQAQLACAVAMAISCVVYLCLILFACCGVCFRKK
jgi:hypothetical protein